MATMTSSKCVFPHLLSMILLVLVKGSLGEQQYDCPKEYLNHGTSCYKFVIDPQLTFQEGEVACRRDHGYLLSVGDASENTYVTEWLKKIDVDRHKWVTSGMRKGGRFKWTSDGTTISHFHFLSDEVKDEIRVDELTGVEYKQIIYKFDEDTGTYTWEWGRLMDPMSYICELAKADLWKLYQNHRDFAFGTGIVDPNLWPVAPNITQQSGDIVFFKRTEYHMTPVTMDCLASGNPPPTYKWYRKTIGGEPVDVSGDNRYSITNGRLYIQKPQVAQDVGEYHCEAINEHGRVLSNPIQLSYGKLDEFPNVATGNYIAKLYMGVEIDCQPPSHSPAIRYNWFRENTNRFIRPDLNKHQFVSKNGKLYISEVGNSDAGDYYCAVFLAPRPGETLASGQPLSRNSLPITLKVQGDNPNMYGPDIQDKFPQLFPEVPLVGQKVQIECLAYGRSLKYNWVRTDAPLNPKAYMVNRNRVLVIDEALLSDSGWYTCVVEGFKSTSNKTRYVSLSGPPSFPIPLQNQFLDMDTPFTWSCLSHGIPVPTYTWYKDSQVLPAYDKDTGVTVRGRHMTFKTVNEQHNGVYECEAVNAHGSRRDSAQLRAISFKPSFSRTPVKESLRASVEGSIMIQCLPEAAPRPDIEWTKDGGSLPSGHVVHPNGALELTTLTTSDSGTYTCQATNSLGTAKSSTQLQISDTTVLAESPTNTVVPINGSTTLRCQASFDSSVSEVMYQWKFFNHVIDFTKEFSYAMPYVDTGAGDLYITAAQYEHEGRYTCIVSTVTDTVQESAYIDVDGPPEEPSGVHRHKGSVDNGPASLELWWIPGKTHKHPISMYIVEFNSDQNDQWNTIKEISDEASKINEEKYVSWRRAVIDEGLSPGGSFRFRVKGGGGDSGYSVPSQPSPYYKMEDAAPVFAPTNVGGGGGSERELQITWDALPRSKWGANKIKYVVYLRRKNGNKLLDGTWRKSEELKTTVYHKTISKEFYYLPYEVKVQAVNDFGAGPNSTMVDVMSAELMPKVLPKFSQANAINATAGTVEWNQVPNTREIVRGSIFGFQVNYWQENTKCLGALEKNAKFTRVYGDVTSADLIGLAPGADYCVNIQILNNAGLGPKTDNYYLGMNDPAPHNYPEYVSVTSHGPDSVRVTWRGVIPRFGESPLIGYHAWYWKMGEDIRSAKVVDFGKSMTGVIHGIGDRDIYTLRLMGYSNGGDGKKAPDVRFTLATQLPFDPRTTEVMNTCPTTRPPVFLAVFVTLLSIIVVL